MKNPLTPQNFLLTYLILNLGYVLALDGTPRQTPNYSFLFTSINTAALLFILYKGNFFNQNQNNDNTK